MSDLPQSPQPSEKDAPGTKKAKDKTSAEFDHFILDTVFPDPGTLLSVRTPRLKDLVGDCVFAFDTNALMAPYYLGAGDSQEISRVLQGLAENNRLFVPTRAVQEFLKNRTVLLRKNYDSLNNMRSNLGQTQSLDTLMCPMFEGKDPYSDLVKSTTELIAVRKKYNESIKGMMDELLDWSWDDPISLLYEKLLIDSRIVPHGVDKEKVLARLQHQILHKRPPGYKDAAKDDEGIGDLLVWLSVLSIARTRKSHVVLVCNEEKADWIVKTERTVLAVRSELTAEFFRETGQHFGLVSYSKFLDLMGAKPATIKRMRLEEELEEYPFLRVKERIDALLKSMCELLKEYYDEVDLNKLAGELIYVRESRLEKLLMVLESTKNQFDNVGRSQGGAAILSDVVGRLRHVQEENDRLHYIDVRGKKSGEVEQLGWVFACEDFFNAHNKWLDWSNSSQ
jgi:hypothetical protein